MVADAAAGRDQEVIGGMFSLSHQKYQEEDGNGMRKLGKEGKGRQHVSVIRMLFTHVSMRCQSLFFWEEKPKKEYLGSECAGFCLSCHVAGWEM